MSVPQFMCPRIRLTKTNKSRLIIPVDAISGIEESKSDKCTKVNTLDGFWYEVINPIEEIDKKIEEAIERVNGRVPLIIPSDYEVNYGSVKGETSNLPKADKFKKKRMLPAGIDKPDRRTGQERNATVPTQTAITDSQKPIDEDTSDAKDVFAS